MSSSAARVEARPAAAKRRQPKRVSKRVVKKSDGRYLIYYEKKQ